MGGAGGNQIDFEPPRVDSSEVIEQFMSSSSSEKDPFVVLDWLYTRSLEGWSIESFLAELMHQLGEVGISLCRVRIGIPVLHPLHVVSAYTWRPDRGVEIETYSRGFDVTNAYLGSPMRPIFESGAEEGRIRITSGTESDRYPLLVDASAHGGTDYFLQLLGYPDRSQPPASQEGILFSWISAAPNGFAEEDLEFLRKIHKPLCMELRSLTQKNLVKDIMHAYLGGYSADRVFSGQIQRGDGDVIEAVILFCDLRGSSTLAEHYGFDEFLHVLNDYYGITAGAVLEAGGEVLRYIGDASLAIFPLERYADEREACEAALSVSLKAVANGERLNLDRSQRGELPIEFGIGLHVGTVMYGNIGTATRLEFTVVGQAANEAARIEAQCKELDQAILVSDRFANQVPKRWLSHGHIKLRNIKDPIEIFSPQ